MKKIISVSLGSSKRDHEVEVEFLNQKFRVSRVGTDGDYKKAQAILRELDGNVDAIGLGGIDVYLYAAGKRYALRDGVRLKEVVKETPVVDGSGLKNTLEKEAVYYIQQNNILPLDKMKVLMVSALDRYGMAEALAEVGADILYGDLIFALGKDKPISSKEELYEFAEKFLPELGKLPIGFLYPIGKKQEEKPDPKFKKYYDNADMIAGDYHFIYRYMPDTLTGKVIFTNTITQNDIEELRKRGVRLLITSTPEFEGRSFGTNVMEAMLVAHLKVNPDTMSPEEYTKLLQKLLQKLDFKPRFVELN